MEVSRRRGTSKGGGVVAGSVWETRMKSDEVKGGIKVFNGEENSEENGDKRVIRPKQSPVGVSGKRKTWKSDNSEGLERSPIQIARQRYDQSKDLGEQCKELSVSSDGGIKKSPVQLKKTRSEVGKELSVSCDGMERSPIRKIKTRSEETVKDLNVFDDRTERNPIPIRKAKSESGNGDRTEKSSVQLRKVKSESNKGLDESIGVNERSPIPLTKAKSVSEEGFDEPGKNFDGLGDGTERNVVELKAAKLDSEPKLKSAIDGPSECPDMSVEAIEKNPVGIEETGSDETCKEFGVCEEKVIWSSLSNLGQVKSAPEQAVDDDDEEEEEEDCDGELDEEIEIEIEEENKRIKVKEINITEQNLKQVVNVEKKIHQLQRPLPISPNLKKLGPPLLNQSRTHPLPTKTKPITVSNGFQRTPETQTGFQRIPETHSRLQSLVDLVMWRDASKSTFVFGMGTFIIISSSYTRDLNISLISVLSYLGLVYLAAIFLFRSIICRGVIDIDDRNQDYVVGEEEAVWLLKMVLPYLNEFLLKLRALFSGDPVTTMKLAVLLFVLARCGSSITIWKMAKLGFFGVFTVPMICSSYSTQLKAYGKFWIGRFKDAWESCSHKKAVAFGIFTLVWNLSSVVARVWAVFMLYVAFRYYHQSVMRNDWVEQEPRPETSWQRQIGVHRRGRGPTTKAEVNNNNNKKDKKRF